MDRHNFAGGKHTIERHCDDCSYYTVNMNDMVLELVRYSGGQRKPKPYWLWRRPLTGRRTPGNTTAMPHDSVHGVIESFFIDSAANSSNRLM